jgi:hypothetical protein
MAVILTLWGHDANDQIGTLRVDEFDTTAEALAWFAEAADGDDDWWPQYILDLATNHRIEDFDVTRRSVVTISD